MSEKKWKRFLKREMDKELQELEGILEEMNSDPNTKDVVAPEEMHDKLFAQIREAEAEKERLSDEEKELIRLGKVYKKTRKWNKALVLVAAVVCALAIGVTSMGGPSKIIQKVQVLLEGNEQINVDTEDGRTEGVKTIGEVEAYEQIEEEFGFYPVRLYYLPEGMEFEQIILSESEQSVYLNYMGEEQKTIVYFIYPNYRTGSIGLDVEDELVDEYDKVINDIVINVKQYFIEENQKTRYKVNYEYQNVYYYLEINNVEDEEVEKIIDNLYFS